jgi:hypothetical protein
MSAVVINVCNTRTRSHYLRMTMTSFEIMASFKQNENYVPVLVILSDIYAIIETVDRRHALQLQQQLPVQLQCEYGYRLRIT